MSKGCLFSSLRTQKVCSDFLQVEPVFRVSDDLHALDTFLCCVRWLQTNHQ